MIFAASGSVARASRLLLIGHRHDAQGEDLVDLRRVEERALALLGDLGVVVEDDRRHQHQRMVTGRSGQHGEATMVPASGDGAVGRCRWLEKRYEVAVGYRGNEVRADERHGDGVVFVVNGRSGVPHRHRQAHEPVIWLCRDIQLRVQCATAADQPACVDRLDVGARVDVDRKVLRQVRIDVERPERDLPFDGLVPAHPGLRSRYEFVGRLVRAAADVLLDAPVLQLQEAHHDRYRCLAPRRDQHLRGQRVVLADAGVGGARGSEHAELPPCLVLPGVGAIRVQQIALVEHRIGDGAGPVPVRGGHRISSVEAAASSEVMASSKPSRPRAERYAASASMVSRFSRSQPVFG